MHLKQLKLAGFKSFVDPVVVPFSSQLVAVVGPNGCGKSNIIDAVRWVMGESHAKHLRGESITDVIFKGSSQRKPVGQASVELIFDNSLGRLVGQYASYQEIAVKRLVTLEGDSSYYLNGSRCRRRDITDIFLGTGAGARGYSIIGQDTISRLIEAHPDDLRVYFEEAAGVSKYKERRRETLQRIQHTRENLARIADIREELDKQLARLERQAKTAERYIALKEAERICRAEILVLKRRTLDAEWVQLQTQEQQLVMQCADHQLRHTAAWQEAESLRTTLETTNAHYQALQQQFYQLATDIARLDETLAQHQRDKQRLAAEEQQLSADLHAAREQLQQEQTSLHQCEQAAQACSQHIEILRQQLSTQQQAVDAGQQQESNWNVAWRQMETAFHLAEREVHVEQVHIQHLAERYQHLQLSFEKHHNEQATLDIDAVQAELAQCQRLHDELKHRHELAAERYQQNVQQSAQLRQQQAEVEQQLHQAQEGVQALAIEHATLLAAQQAALYQVHAPAANHRARWETTPRLTETLTVEKEWVPVCEHILRDCLHAIVLDSVDELWPLLPDLAGEVLTFVQPLHTQAPREDVVRLMDKITGQLPRWPVALEHIFAANDLTQALAWLPTLDAGQSVITPTGYWIGHGWVRILPLVHDDDAGLIARQQRLTVLQTALTAQQEALAAITAKRAQLHQVCVLQQQEQALQQQDAATCLDEFRACHTKLQQLQQRLAQSLARQAQLADAFVTVQEELETCATQHVEATLRHQMAAQNCTTQAAQKQQLMAEKESFELSLQAARNAFETTRQALHQMELEHHRETTKLQQLTTQLQRAQRHIDTLQARLHTLEAQALALTAPAAEEKALLIQKTAQHAQLEMQVAHERQNLDALQQQVQAIERLSRHDEQQAKVWHEQLQQVQLQAQALSLRVTGLTEALTELEADVEHLLAHLPPEITPTQREQELLTLTEKINRLGAINLLAIEEYQADMERKQHLELQYQDLMDAIATLEMAIAKMDKETQLRLKETFDQVNVAFQQLFPRLFGGGHAQLTLTCDNLLEAGILVMAQPPGKRNSTIHMLSGGEKAMTAVALVFAIFQQNPSPFCMLDEVDAPLDDANVRRFCELVKEMSEFVQFLFITHNKVTMELADHLIGVTMREPGVSRVVAVDVETYF